MLDLTSFFLNPVQLKEWIADHRLQVINTWGVYLSGAATASAVIVSLWLARKDSKEKLKLRVMLGSNEEEDFIVADFRLYNHSTRPITVEGFMWFLNWKGKRYSFPVSNVVTRQSKSPLPVRVEARSSENFYALLFDPGYEPDWENGESEQQLVVMVNRFPNLKDTKVLRNLRCEVVTSLGTKASATPDPLLLDRLKEFAEA